jgi:NAD(P)-dependent dehydrogenase (short-subunit alcohol dehydrogenase family)
VDEVGERLGPVDILVLNASTEVRRNWLDIDRSDFEEQVAVNLRASLVLDLPPESRGVRSEYQAATRMVSASMLARASAGVR